MQRELEVKVQELEEELNDLKEDVVPKLREQLVIVEAEHTQRERDLINTHREELAELQRICDRKEKLIKDLNEQLKVIIIILALHDICT